MIRTLITTILLIAGSFLIMSEKDLLLSLIKNYQTIDQNKNLAAQNKIYKINVPNNSDFQSLFEIEMSTLKKKLDQRLFKVRSVEWISRDPEIETEKLKMSKSFQINPKSPLTLEIEIFSQNDGENKTTITQFNYTDFNTKNKVHEFSRMFKIKGKKKPD